MYVDVALTPASIKPEELKGKSAIVLDVFRATTVIVAALTNGARSIRPVKEINEAQEAQQKDQALLIGGERGGVKLEGFNFGNSPAEYKRENVGDRGVVLTTSNGTKAILHARNAQNVFIGCLNNADAVARAAAEARIPVAIICAGEHGHPATEDTICAGLIADTLSRRFGYALKGEGVHQAIAEYFQNRSNMQGFLALCEDARSLQSLGHGEDVSYASRINTSPLVPRYSLQNNLITAAPR